MKCSTAIVLCGGEGTRFRNISRSPKILTEYRGKPFLEFIVQYLQKHGIEDIVLALGYNSGEIISYIKSNNNLQSVRYLVEKEKLNTGGAVLFVHSIIKSPDKKRYLVLNGDTLWKEYLSQAALFDEEDRVHLFAHRIKINDRYDEISSLNGTLKFTRGSEDKILFNSLVYSGVASIPSSILGDDIKKITFENLLFSLGNWVPFTIHEITSKVIDFGTAEGYSAFLNEQ